MQLSGSFVDIDLSDVDDTATTNNDHHINELHKNSKTIVKDINRLSKNENQDTGMNTFLYQSYMQATER